jgi:hypothetical protein
VILNSYAILDLFLSLFRLGLGLMTCWLAFSAWKSWRLIPTDYTKWQALEDSSYLVYLLSGLLLILNVLSWPILFLLLQSYVSQWPSVMCIYGVTRIGSGSVGSSRFLPPLLMVLQIAKPLLIFLSGTWFALYIVNRRTATAPLTGRVLCILMAASSLAVIDAAAELTYLIIPKKEQFLSSGCCMGLTDQGPARFIPPSLQSDQSGALFYPAYLTINLALILALLVCARLCRRGLPVGWLPPLFLASLLSLAIFAVFLIDEAAPRLLHLPNHHCFYDLLPQAPRSFASVVLFVVGTLCVGWGCAVGWLASRLESRLLASELIGILFRVGALGYVLSLIILSVELATA